VALSDRRAESLGIRHRGHRDDVQGLEAGTPRRCEERPHLLRSDRLSVVRAALSAVAGPLAFRNVAVIRSSLTACESAMGRV